MGRALPSKFHIQLPPDLVDGAHQPTARLSEAPDSAPGKTPRGGASARGKTKTPRVKPKEKLSPELDVGTRAGSFKSSLKVTGKTGATTPRGDPRVTTPRVTTPRVSKAKAKGGEKNAALEATSDVPVPVLRKEAIVDGHYQKEVEYYTDELLARKPLDEATRSALVKKAGTPMQVVSSVRAEGKRPPGRLDENQSSRHERVPPAAVVLMFNWCARARARARVLTHGSARVFLSC